MRKQTKKKKKKKIKKIKKKKKKKKKFLNNLQEIGTKFYEKTTGNYHNDYTITYPHDSAQSINGEYVLDMVKKLGKYNSDDEVGEPVNSIINLWVEEYKIVAEMADSQMNTASQSFNEILGSKITSVTDSLDKGIEAMDGVDSSIGDIKSSISDVLADNAGTIDEYGKLGVKAVFGILALIDIAIAVFMLLLCFCSGKCCTKCCCCRCLCKLFTHLLWNILALLMIIVFLVGSLFALIGKVGSDAMSVISYVVSDDNIGAGGDGILVDQLGENKKYINRCIGGDGKIEEEFNLDLSQINSINNISDAESQIREAKREFTEKKDTLFTYNTYIAELEKRVELTTDELSLLHIEHDNKALNLKVVLEEMNQGIQGYDD